MYYNQSHSKHEVSVSLALGAQSYEAPKNT
jgi:hypothetical protein